MHGRQTSYTNRTFKSLHFGVFSGFLKERVFLQFFCATKVGWTYIYAYSGEWVNFRVSMPTLYVKNKMAAATSRMFLLDF